MSFPAAAAAKSLALALHGKVEFSGVGYEDVNNTGGNRERLVVHMYRNLTFEEAARAPYMHEGYVIRYVNDEEFT